MEEKELKSGSEHSHHHHHKHKHSKKSKNKFTKFVRENKRPLIGVSAATVLFGAILILSIGPKRQTPAPTLQAEPVVQTQVQVEEMVGLSIPHLSGDVALADEWAKACISDPNMTPALQLLAGYREDGLRLDRGLSVKLRYEVVKMPKSCYVKEATLLISEDPTFPQEGLRKFLLKEDERSKEVSLLKVDTNYYYRFDVTLSDGSEVSVLSKFHTAVTPRILTIEGLANVRDIGGWADVDGRVIKQGLLYRGSEFDNAADRGYQITKQGFEDLMSLGIKFDMDLREHDVADKGTGTLGVTKKVYDCPMYVQIFNEDRQDELKAIFDDLSNPDNYPIYLHCTHGKDRTGTVVFLLEAVLGVCEEDLIREFELSALYFEQNKDISTDDLRKTMDRLESEYPGDTLQESVRAYLLSIGITEEQLATLKTIYLG